MVGIVVQGEEPSTSWIEPDQSIRKIKIALEIAPSVAGVCGVRGSMLKSST
jgi:hypothetical protein